MKSDSVASNRLLVDRILEGTIPVESSFTLSSWNILAESYTSARTFWYCPPDSLPWASSRRKRVEKVLEALSLRTEGLPGADIVCLQEVDPVEDVVGSLRELGYHCVVTGRPCKKRDALVCAYRGESIRLITAQSVCLDIAPIALEITPPSLRGRLQRSNVAQVLMFEVNGSVLVICHIHAHWNPALEDVKMIQVASALEVADRLVDTYSKSQYPHQATRGYFLVGDLNAGPPSPVIDLLTQGEVIVPVCGFNKSQSQEASPTSCGSADRDELSESVVPSKEHGEVRFLLDATLRRLLRWFRLVGVDVEMETEAEHTQRTRSALSGDSGDDFDLFTRCRRERRVLVTTSKGLVKRRRCPMAVLVDVAVPSTEDKSSKHTHLERVFRDLLVHFGVRLRRDRLLRFCAGCGGAITQVHQDRIASAREVRYSYGYEELCESLSGIDIEAVDSVEGAPYEEASEIRSGLIQEDAALMRALAVLDRQTEWEKPVFECVSCVKIYWVSGKPTSSSQRATSLADHLCSLLPREFVVEHSLSDDATIPDQLSGKALNAMEEKEVGCSESSTILGAVDGKGGGASDNARIRVGSIEKDRQWASFQVRLGPRVQEARLSDAFADVPDGSSTNVTPGFRGRIDHIWYAGDAFQRLWRSQIPAIDPPSALPDTDWPSDHMLISASFVELPRRARS